MLGDVLNQLKIQRWRHGKVVGSEKYRIQILDNANNGYSSLKAAKQKKEISPEMVKNGKLGEIDICLSNTETKGLKKNNRLPNERANQQYLVR